jgi:Protein of unknown function (DUF1569)
MNAGAAVDTRKVRGRRSLSLGSLDALLAEAERLASGPVRTLGNWSLGQVLDHLAAWMEFSIDGVPVRLPRLIRLVARPLRSWIVRRRMPAGFRWLEETAKRVLPQRPIDTAEGLEHLRRAISRLRTEAQRAPSPLLGRLTAEEWERFHLWHAAHHLSFIVPKTG